MTHEQSIESAASYALDALDADERAAFEAHLVGCAECREAVASYREVAGMLAHAVPAAARPSAELRERILRDARRVRSIGVAARPNGAVPVAAPKPVAGIVTEKPGSRRPVVPWAIAVASLAAAIALGFVYQAERAHGDQLLSELAAAQAALGRQDSALAAFVGPEVHVVSLTAAADRKPLVRVFWNHTRRTFIVTAIDLPQAPAGKTYQLWALRKGQAPMAMGTFAVSEGAVVTTLAVPPAITDGGFIDDCALTIEPDGGSPQPTETPRLVGSWRHVD
jgi:anti-sigma-K factor RskA